MLISLTQFHNHVLDISDRKILLGTAIVSIMMTAISIFSEMLYKYIKEEAHIGYSKHYVYLGAKLEDLTTTPWFLFWTLSLVWLLVVALSFYWAIRRR